MRAARFAAQLGSCPAPEVVAAMTEMADRIAIISAERVRDELTKLLLADRPRAGLDLLVHTGLADRVLPELPALRLERDEHHRHKDVYEHSLTVLEQAIDLESRLRPGTSNWGAGRPDLISRLAALLHDIGKPATRRFEAGGKVSFHHHDVVGAKLVRKRLTALRFSTDGSRRSRIWSSLHLRFHGYGEHLGETRCLDRFGGPPLRPRRRRPAGPAAHPDPGRLHHPEPGQGRPAAGGVRRSRTPDRRAGRARRS